MLRMMIILFSSLLPRECSEQHARQDGKRMDVATEHVPCTSPCGGEVRTVSCQVNNTESNEEVRNMAGKYTEFEKQANGVRIVLLPEAREDVEAIAEAELDATASWAR